MCALFGANGCTGLSFGRNLAGADTSLGNGSLAVDHRTENVFVLAHESDSAGPRALLRAIAPDDGSVRTVGDLTGHDDERVLFPASGVLVMSEWLGSDVLDLYDEATLALKATRRSDARYHGTRMSPSRNWIAVADNKLDPAPIHLVDAATLEPHVIPHRGAGLEAMWLHASDRLVGAIFEAPPAEGAEALVRVRVWDVATLARAGFATDASGAWAAPEFEVTVPGKTADLCISFTWIGVSPDDRTLVLPVRDTHTHGYELVVIDVATHSFRSVPHAKGPVGFLPDGNTIVSYRARDDGEQRCSRGGLATSSRSKEPSAPPLLPAPAPAPAGHGSPEDLLLIDVATLEARRIDTSEAYPFNFDIVGTTVVVAPLERRAKPGPLLFIDAAGEPVVRRMEGLDVQLSEYVERPGGELWLVNHGELGVLDVPGQRYAPIDIPLHPAHVNVLPKRDWIVVDDPLERLGARPGHLLFYAPAVRDIRRIVSLRP